jgi:hypothetical protein
VNRLERLNAEEQLITVIAEAGGTALGEGGVAGQGRTSRAFSLKRNQNPWPELEKLWWSCGGGVPSRTSTSTKPYSSQTSSKEILPLQPAISRYAQCHPAHTRAELPIPAREPPWHGPATSPSSDPHQALRSIPHPRLRSPGA